MKRFKIFNIILFLLSVIICKVSLAREVRIGSKKDSENYLLAEIMAQLLESRGVEAERHFGLGGTMVAYQALAQREIDLYPDYTGTIVKVILKQNKNLSLDEINNLLGQQGLEVLPSFGFNNTYAIAMRRSLAEQLRIKKISDLKNHKHHAVFSYEFLYREDGWPALREFYRLRHITTQGIEHELAYPAVAQNKAQVMDAYSTDAKIVAEKMILLEDDKNFFPNYYAVPFINKSLAKNYTEILQALVETLNNVEMQELNAEILIGKKSYKQVARKFLIQKGLVAKKSVGSEDSAQAKWQNLWQKLGRHLYLTFVALLFAVIFAIPFGVLIEKYRLLAEPIVALTSLLQTVPSIALLAFMIPLFGIGVKPAIVALFLYSLLPILRNTYVALKNVSTEYIESARGIGLTSWEILYLIKFPLATPVILAGIRTAAVINIGTATLAAFIGAGGLGEYIVTGLTLNDHRLILLGAVPSAALAILVEILFSYWEKKLKSHTL